MDSAARSNPELSAARRGLRPRGPFNPRAKLAPGNSVVRAPGIKANAVPRPGDLRSAAASLSRGRIPQGSLAAQIGQTIRDVMQGGSGPTIMQAAGSQMVAATRRSLGDYNRQRVATGQRPFDFPGRRGLLGDLKSQRVMRPLNPRRRAAR